MNVFLWNRFVSRLDPSPRHRGSLSDAIHIMRIRATNPRNGVVGAWAAWRLPGNLTKANVETLLAHLPEADRRFQNLIENGRDRRRVSSSPGRSDMSPRQ